MIKKAPNFKKIILLFLILLSFVCTNAQSSKTIDSLMVVKDYLLTIKGALPHDASEVSQSIKNLDSLIHLGTQKKIFFDKQLQIILKNNPEEIKALLQKYDLVLQSAIVVKTDLKQHLFGTAETKKEMYYLYGSSSFLVDRIYFHSSSYKSRILESKY
ncbi:hypothetical protein ACEN2I_01630 [Flavobacterium sp. W22_SRS_FK3]|uniref:hypothetical protein n=1 Tax=Flavobacterium sp. W22_SRS_FK3 TaxID=3240275 RepID=UPI003F90DE5C